MKATAAVIVPAIFIIAMGFLITFFNPHSERNCYGNGGTIQLVNGIARCQTLPEAGTDFLLGIR